MTVQTTSATAAAPGSTMLGGDAAPAPAAAPGGAPPAEVKETKPAAAAAGAEGKGKAEEKVDPKPGPPLSAEAKAEKEKADAAKAAAEAAGEIQVKLPDGFKEDASFAGFKDWAKKHGVKSEAAQELINLHAATQLEQAKQYEAARDQRIADSEKQLRSDKDFGGDKFDANVQEARKAVKKFGDAELKKYFAEDPDGRVVANIPGLVKMLARIGKADAEDSVVRSDGGGKTPAASKDAFEKAMYPNSPELKFAGSRGG